MQGINKFSFFLIISGVFAGFIAPVSLFPSENQEKPQDSKDIVISTPTNVRSSNIIFETFNYPDGSIKEKVYYEDGKEIAKEIFDRIR